MNLAEYKGVYVFAQQVDNEISQHRSGVDSVKAKDLANDLENKCNSSFSWF